MDKSQIAALRAQITYDEDSRRVRVGFDGIYSASRLEHWIGYDVAEYADGPRIRCSHYAGPKDTDRRSSAGVLVWDMRIAELEQADRKTWYKVQKGATTCAGYDIWKRKFGDAKKDARAAAALEKRRKREHNRRDRQTEGVRLEDSTVERPNERQKVAKASDRHDTAGVTPVPKQDSTDQMDDGDLLPALLKFSIPFDEKAYRRCAALLQAKRKRAQPIAWELLRDIRDEAPSWCRDNPKNMLLDERYAQYLKATEKIGTEKPQPPVKIGKPGEALAGFQERVKVTNAYLDWLIAQCPPPTNGNA